VAKQDNGHLGKIHLKIKGIDYRWAGQPEFDYQHQTACGYVRKNITNDKEKVTCFYCKRTEYFLEGDGK